MKLRFGLLISIVGTILWTWTMYSLNYRSADSAEFQAVAGVSTSITNVPDSTQPLTTVINSARDGADSPLLIEDARLNELARLRLEDMVTRKYYSHVSPSGENFTDLLQRVSLPKTTLTCENLLLTQATETEVWVREWLASSTHADCMLNSEMTRVGVAEGVFDELTEQKIVVTIYAQSR